MRLSLLIFLLSLSVEASTIVTADQGAPGKQGCWPVCGTFNVMGLDGGPLTVNGTVVVIGPDGGSVPVNITQSIPIQVFMDGGQHVIADQGAPGSSPWACYVAMDGGQQITVNQGTSPWACYVATDGGQHFIVDQGTIPWVVTFDGGFMGTVNVIFDGGFIGTTATQPCSASAEANTSVGAAAVPVPASPLVGRNWIRVCNSPFNSPPTQCICSISTCPTYVSTSVGDVLANSDCVTYNLGLADAGVPCCICNGAAKRLLSLECKVP
jgi:hypothetical protein